MKERSVAGVRVSEPEDISEQGWFVSEGLLVQCSECVGGKWVVERLYIASR